MSTKIRLRNCGNEFVVFDIGDVAKIVFAILREISGDEVLEVFREDKTDDTYDSDTHCRTTDYDDGFRVVCRNGMWDEKFLSERTVADTEVR